jgi:hypothetical protein
VDVEVQRERDPRGRAAVERLDRDRGARPPGTRRPGRTSMCRMRPPATANVMS